MVCGYISISYNLQDSFKPCLAGQLSQGNYAKMVYSTSLFTGIPGGWLADKYITHKNVVLYVSLISGFSN